MPFWWAIQGTPGLFFFLVFINTFLSEKRNLPQHTHIHIYICTPPSFLRVTTVWSDSSHTLSRRNQIHVSASFFFFKLIVWLHHVWSSALLRKWYILDILPCQIVLPPFSWLHSIPSGACPITYLAPLLLVAFRLITMFHHNWQWRIFDMCSWAHMWVLHGDVFPWVDFPASLHYRLVSSHWLETVQHFKLVICPLRQSKFSEEHWFLTESRLSELDRLMLWMTHIQITLGHLQGTWSQFSSPDPHIDPSR